MTVLANPDLAARVRSLVRALRGLGFGVHDAVIVTDNRPLPFCEWCELDGPEHGYRVALLELFFDCGSILTCWDCALAVAIVAANESQDGWFWVEITQGSTE